MYIPYSSRHARQQPAQAVPINVDGHPSVRPSSLLIRASSLVQSYIRMTTRLVCAALGLGLALVLAVSGLFALVLFQCRARKKGRRQRAMSGESFACPGETAGRPRPAGWRAQPRTAVNAPLLEQDSISPTFTAPPPAYTESVSGSLTTATSLTLPRILTDEIGLRPRAHTLESRSSIAPTSSVAPSRSFLQLLSAAGLRNSVQEDTQYAHISTEEGRNTNRRYHKCFTKGTAELEVVSSYASEDEEGQSSPYDPADYPARPPHSRHSRNVSRQSSDLAYLQEDNNLIDNRPTSRASCARYSRFSQAHSRTKDSITSLESDLLTRLTPEPLTPITPCMVEPGGLQVGWSFPVARDRDAAFYQRRYHASLSETSPIKLELPPKPSRERSTTHPPQGPILHHLVNPIYNPAAARSKKGHRRSKSSGSVSSTSSGQPLAMGLGMVGLGLTLGATLHNGTGLRRLSLVPEEENPSIGEIKRPESVYVPTATRTQTGMHRRSQSMPVERSSLTLIPPNPILPHHRRSPSLVSADTLTSSSNRSSSPIFLSPLLSTPSTTGPETPVFAFPPEAPATAAGRERSTTLSSVDGDHLTIKIYYSSHGHVDPSRNSYFDSSTETVKFRLPRTAVFGELCIKVWEKLGLPVNLLMYDDMTVDEDSDLEGEGCAKRKMVGAEEWRDVCERAQSRVYFWAKDAEVNIVSP
ncbi:hypothetical protein DACRYDRAFT_111113 [Dacryopinax primogenitus]|uniref:Uncharacterized protein n=1 Tax=Dacryopinax primogenitus (strain DJM 731) TaxID=1858805 RepID=M5G2Z4_DACPD|nr:uncharacterized protein DACRYDRAFT_111113 [Dacryopinax primogenitus]EJT98132.1 hypothetical protein DACRYDRAFT_111113 [Dacryopinax primogenitus]